jgi:hypothetical protein
MTNNTIINEGNYSLFLDDERFPSDKTSAPFGDWIICRSTEQAKDTIIAYGIPKHISFDHDLGENVPTGYDLVKWLTENDMDNKLSIDNLNYFVHSANPIGKQNIEGLLNNYLIFKKSTQEKNKLEKITSSRKNKTNKIL